MKNENKFIQEVKKRAELTIKGPWVSRFCNATNTFDVEATKENAEWPLVASVYADNGKKNMKNLATFIAYSRTDIPRLLSIVEKLQKRLIHHITR